MAVAGSVEERHGIILAKNELAKKYGIVTAETVASARRKCPSLVLCPPHYDEYVRYSRAAGRIYAFYTDLVEPFGIDESWLDVTASRKLFGGGETIAQEIRQRMKTELGITVSVGVSFNKVFAKLGSDYKKPDAVTVISRDNFRQIVYPLPVSALLFVGRHTEETLRRMGVYTIGDLAETEADALYLRLGKPGEALGAYARGEDDSPVSPIREAAKSISNGFTFPRDLTGRAECRLGIAYLTEEIGTKLRAGHMKCTTVTLKIKDSFLRTVQKQKKISPPTDITREIVSVAENLLSDMWKSDAPVRMITVGVSDLVGADSGEQMTLFDDMSDVQNRGKIRKRDEAVDGIRQKFGAAAIMTASFMGNDSGLLFAKSEKNEKDQKKSGL